MVHNIDRPDVCLEIGCHEGLTTNIISNRATFVTGIDTAPEVVRIAASRHPHLAFHVLDGLDVEATRALSPTGTYTRICIDISGKAPLELICQMIAAQRAAFPDAALIVKNEQLYDALQLAAATSTPHEAGRADAVPQEQQASATASTAEGGAAASAAEPAAEAVPRQAAAEAAARLHDLLGSELLAECELFRHQFRPPRTRPVRPRGTQGTGPSSPSPCFGDNGQSSQQQL